MRRGHSLRRCNAAREAAGSAPHVVRRCPVRIQTSLWCAPSCGIGVDELRGLSPIHESRHGTVACHCDRDADRITDAEPTPAERASRARAAYGWILCART